MAINALEKIIAFFSVAFRDIKNQIKMTYKFKIRTSLAIAYLLLNSMLPTSLWSQDISQKIDNKDFDPSTLLWYKAPADIWENALPVGNGRLGAMIFGGVEEERIQVNEDT